MDPETNAALNHVDEIEADVECLMCARVIGQLYGHRWRRAGDRRTARVVANLSTYRENEPGALPRPVWPSERFRCRHCGGRGYVGEIMIYTAPDELPAEVCPFHALVPRSGPGRPPRGCICEPTRAAA